MSTPRLRRHFLLIISLSLLLIAFALRVYRLDYQSIWWDEGISLHLATSSLGDIVQDRLSNIHPPLYFIMLKVWLGLVGVSAFTGRYLSVLASLGQVALIIGAVGYWARAGQGSLHSNKQGTRARDRLVFFAAVLMVLSPLAVIYGQEIRVYAMLPLVYLSMLLLASVILFSSSIRLKPLVLLAITEWVGLHLHYIVIFGVMFVGILGLVILVRRKDFPALKQWIGMQAVVAFLSLPWLIAVLGNWSAIQAEANAGTFAAEPVSLPFLLSQVWVFQLTGLPGALAIPFVRLAAAVAAILTLSLLIIRLTPRLNGRRALSLPIEYQAGLIVRLSLQWALPLLSALLVWSVRSFSHPRYVIAFTIALIPLLAFLSIPAKSWWMKTLAIVMAVCVLSLSVWGLKEYYFNPQRAKPDMRGVAHYLEANAGPRDLILIPDTDWSLPFEYEGPSPIRMATLDAESGGAVRTPATLLVCLPGQNQQADCVHPERVFLVDYPRGTRDWQNRVPFELERLGFWSNLMEFDDVSVMEYQLEIPVEDRLSCSAGDTQPETHPIEARFDGMRLDSAWVEKEAAVDTAVAIALCWLPEELVKDDLVVSLVLRDPLTGERLGQVDSRLVDMSGAPTSNWSVGNEVVTYHVLPFMAGTPPITAEVNLSVYVPDDNGPRSVTATGATGSELTPELSLADLTLVAPASQTPLPYLREESSPGHDMAQEITPGLLFLGTHGLPVEVRPGQTIRIPLVWQAKADKLPDYQPELVLEQANLALVGVKGAPVQERVPTSRWQLGQIVQEFRDLRVPAGSDGSARLVLLVGDQRIELGEIMIQGEAAQLERPDIANPTEVIFGEEIKLVGFDAPVQPILAGESFPITLYWQSLSDEVSNNYSIFVHVISEDGRMIAQHDGPPANGQRPTFDWLAGEYVIDSHLMEWREPDYVGPARVLVGLYNPLTGERLRIATDADSYGLPVTLSISSGN